jgi:hypothetical protein
MTLWYSLGVWFFMVVGFGAYRGLQTRFGPNVLEGWRAYKRELHNYGTSISELRRARHDPVVAAAVDQKYQDWLYRKSSHVTVELDDFQQSTDLGQKSFL